jgi:hypothetical protein
MKTLAVLFPAPNRIIKINAYHTNIKKININRKDEIIGLPLVKNGLYCNI